MKGAPMDHGEDADEDEDSDGPPYLSDDEARKAILRASQVMESLTWSRKVLPRSDPRSILHGLDP